MKNIYLKNLILTFSLVSTTAFGAESIMLNDLMNDYGNGVETLLVGKNVVNNKSCYFKLHRGGFYKLFSVDSSGMFQDEEVNTIGDDTIRVDKVNEVKISNQDVTPAVLGRTAEAKINRNNKILKVELRNDANLKCEFDLEQNRNLPAVPQNCGNENITKTIRECHYTKNLGNENHQVTGGKLELQEITFKRCVPGGVFENFAGYIIKNGQVDYVGNSTGLDGEWYNMSIKDHGRMKNNETIFSQKTRHTEYTFHKNSNELDIKHVYEAGLFDQRKIAAKFKCE